MLIDGPGAEPLRPIRNARPWLDIARGRTNRRPIEGEIPQRQWGVIVAWLDEGLPRWCAAKEIDIDANVYLVPGPKGILSRQSFKKVWNRCVAGSASGLKPHLIRHVAATLWLAAHPGDYATVAAFLGGLSQDRREFYARGEGAAAAPSSRTSWRRSIPPSIPISGRSGHDPPTDPTRAGRCATHPPAGPPRDVVVRMQDPLRREDFPHRGVAAAINDFNARLDAAGLPPGSVTTDIYDAVATSRSRLRALLSRYAPSRRTSRRSGCAGGAKVGSWLNARYNAKPRKAERTRRIGLPPSAGRPPGRAQRQFSTGPSGRTGTPYGRLAQRPAAPLSVPSACWRRAGSGRMSAGSPCRKGRPQNCSRPLSDFCCSSEAWPAALARIISSGSACTFSRRLFDREASPRSTESAALSRRPQPTIDRRNGQSFEVSANGSSWGSSPSCCGGRGQGAKLAGPIDGRASPPPEGGRLRAAGQYGRPAGRPAEGADRRRTNPRRRRHMASRSAAGENRQQKGDGGAVVGYLPCSTGISSPTGQAAARMIHQLAELAWGEPTHA